MAFRSSSDRLISLFVAAALVCAGPARAEEPVSPDVESSANELIKNGVELRRVGRDAEALALFHRAQALAPSGRGEAQIALAEQALSLWIDAERDLAAAMARRDDPWISEHMGALKEAARVVAAHLAWITVNAKSTEGASLYVNGQHAPGWPREPRLRVVAGRVAIELRTVTTSTSRTIEVAPETETAISLAAPEPPPPTPRDVPASADGTPRRTAGLITLAAGAVGVGIGAVFGIRALSLKSERDAACAGGLDRCSQAGVDADRSGRTAALVSTVATGVGLGFAVVGGWLVLSAPRAASAPPAVAAGRFTIRIQPSGTSLTAIGTF